MPSTIQILQVSPSLKISKLYRIEFTGIPGWPGVTGDVRGRTPKLTDEPYARDLQAQGTCALRFYYINFDVERDSKLNLFYKCNSVPEILFKTALNEVKKYHRIMGSESFYETNEF